MKSVLSILLTLSMLSFFSCGSDDDDSEVTIIQEQEQTPSVGDFSANVIPVNPAIVSNPASTNTIRIINDDVSARIASSGLSGNTIVRQQIRNSRSCPSIADDINGDGFVDGVEAQSRTGGVMIPLDGDINTQTAGNSINPATNRNGSYTYNRSGSLSRILADLTTADPNPNDIFIKLNPGAVLNIEGAVFDIYGIPESVNLPSTVAALPGLSAHQSFPVACGLLQQVSGETTGGTTGGGGGNDDELSCRIDLQILCPQGQIDGCVTGQTRTHQCVAASPVSCAQDLQILCPPGFRDGCEMGQTTTHRCVRPNAVSCEIELQILCPAGFRDGCIDGRTTTHRCVRQTNPACSEDIRILCPPGFRDGCETGQTTTHRCVRQNAVSCMEHLEIQCPPGQRDGCETGQTTTHRCVPHTGGASCSVDVAILCPTGFSDGCLNGRTETHQCIRNEP